MKAKRTTLFALLISVSSIALLAGACGDDHKKPVAVATCTLAGDRCEFGCSPNLGCVRCQNDTTCVPGAPHCVLGACAQCATNSQCGTGQACYPANHTCQPSCTTNADCPQLGGPPAPICNTTTGACVGCQTDADCTNTTGRPLCDTERGQCSECLSNANCPDAAPACNRQNGTCAVCLVDTDCGPNYLCSQGDDRCHPKCTSNADCTAPNQPLCNPLTGACVQCTSATDCLAGQPICNPDNHQCVQCVANTDCSAGTPICNVGDHRCVECTVSADCPSDGGRRVCRADRCVECQTNADCTNAQLPNCDRQTNTCTAG